MSSNTTVPVGPTSIVGWSTALLAFAGALIAYLTGDHTAQSVTAVELAGSGLLSLVVTQAGRYSQVQRLENILRPDAEAVLDDVKHTDPDFNEQVRTFIKDELAKVAARVESEDPATDASSTPAETAAPAVGDQSALAAQFQGEKAS